MEENNLEIKTEEQSAEAPAVGKKQKIVSRVVAVLLAAALIFCIYTVTQVLSKGYVTVGGYSMFRVMTGSMEPTLQVNSLLLSRQTPIEEIKVGDIVCYRSRNSQTRDWAITHRVVAIRQSADGSPLLETRGDNNPVSDTQYVTAANLIGKVVWHSREGSSFAVFISWLTGKIGFLACIVLPVLLICGIVLRDSVKGIRTELAKALAELEEEQAAEPAAQTLLTEEEIKEITEKVKAELTEELKQNAGV